MARRKEKRQFRRWKCMMPCRCEGVGFSSNGLIMDLSRGGAGISGTSKLPAEDLKLLVTIRPRVESTELSSRVVWVQTPGQETGLAEFGVKFLGPRHGIEERLKVFFPRYHALNP